VCEQHALEGGEETLTDAGSGVVISRAVVHLDLVYLVQLRYEFGNED
jgi:hypothetical protein